MCYHTILHGELSNHAPVQSLTLPLGLTNQNLKELCVSFAPNFPDDGELNPQHQDTMNSYATGSNMTTNKGMSEMICH